MFDVEVFLLLYNRMAVVAVVTW